MNKILLTLFILIPTIAFSHELKGNASWYGGKFIGRQTANGEKFDTEKLTAAHKTLPFNTVVDVTNISNGKTVRVRINDRGPFVEGRIIDLSKKAATDIDMINSGTASVKLKIISMPKSPQIVDIQVAAYSNILYASAMKKKLSDKGFSPSTSLSKNGIMRIMLTNIPVNKSYTIVQKLEQMGIDKILIKYKG
ncbi:MAG: hypothetical protein B6229_10185 [Spirochaetaceae bacterium 4572_7]|nr:MAG: hypothetical protein B6229_10185 [Spirochaetaceae bacterium 4572_7]